MIDVKKAHWPELGLDCLEVTITNAPGERQNILDQLEAERLGWA